MGKLNKSLMILMVSLVMMITSGAVASPAVSQETIVPAATQEQQELEHTQPSTEAEHDAHALDAAAGETGHAEKKAGLPQLEPKWYPSQIFWLFVTFAVMYTSFSFLVLPSLSNTLQNRQDHIQGNLNKAHAMNEEAQLMKKTYEELMSDTFVQSSSLMAETDKSIKVHHDEVIGAFQKNAEEQIRAMEKQIIQTKKKALGDMHDIAAEIASAAAKKIVGIDTDIAQVRNVVKNIDKKAA